MGLGYVGISLAALLASKGYDVLGIDISRDRAGAVNRGSLPLKGEEPGLEEMLRKAVRSGRLAAGTSYKELRGRKTVFVCVDTPIDAEKRPDHSRLERAVADIARNISKGTLVIIESTVAPGTTLGLVAKTLERESGLKVGRDLKLAHCPERVMPGRLLYNLTHYDRVIGGLDRASVNRALAIYSKLTKGRLHATDITTAEVVKTAENAYRDVQIAFANEVALISEKVGVDAFEVRRLVNTCPFRDMHTPGAGVGGHCLPKDPWLLVYGGREADPRLIPVARAMNDSMPFHVLDLAHAALREAGRELSSSVVAVMGASFLQDSGDLRNSPSAPVVASLSGAQELRVHDPYADELDGRAIDKDLKKVLQGADLAVFMVAHKEYSRLTPAAMRRLMRTPAVVDGRNIFSAQVMNRAGFVYRGVGKRSSR